jgi:hypothetical protein
VTATGIYHILLLGGSWCLSHLLLPSMGPSQPSHPHRHLSTRSSIPLGKQCSMSRGKKHLKQPSPLEINSAAH